MMRDIFLYLVLIILFGLIFLAQLIVNVYAFQRQPTQKSRTDEGECSEDVVIPDTGYTLQLAIPQYTKAKNGNILYTRSEP